MNSGGSRGELVAAIDIGTNSVLLLIAEKQPGGSLAPLIERATITRLGQGVDKTRVLHPDAVARTLSCLATYGAELERHGRPPLRVVGTSAMRDAGGGSELADQAEALLGTRPATISGQDEARLTFRGGLSGIELAGPAMVFDIGGGSTEFISGTRAVSDGATSHTIRWADSLDVGSVRLTERHVRSDPPSAAERTELLADIDRSLQSVTFTRTETLVGVAGTLTTLAAIARGIDPYDAQQIHGARLSLAEVRQVTETLLCSTLADRLKLPGLSEKRADVIGAGGLLALRIMETAGADSVVVSDRGVRWGLAEELANS